MSTRVPWLAAAAVATVFVLSVVAAPASACNSTYCSGRGQGSVRASGVDGCACNCTWPFYGYRCRYIYFNSQLTVDCGSGVPSSGPDECAAHSDCYWSTSAGECLNKQVTATANRTGSRSTLPTVAWCYKLLPVPLQFTVYTIAVIAFGVGGIGTFYTLRFRNTYSIVDENGERIFNQFHGNSWMVLTYSALLFVSAGALAITAYINFRDPSECAFVVFFIIYLIVQGLVIIWPLKWLVEHIIARWTAAQRRVVDLDTVTKPIRPQMQQFKNSCQLRCF
jgi:hypothetical protein